MSTQFLQPQSSKKNHNKLKPKLWANIVTSNGLLLISVIFFVFCFTSNAYGQAMNSDYSSQLLVRKLGLKVSDLEYYKRRSVGVNPSRLVPGGPSHPTRLVPGGPSHPSRLVPGGPSHPTRLVPGGPSHPTRLVPGGPSHLTRPVPGGPSHPNRLILGGPSHPSRLISEGPSHPSRLVPGGPNHPPHFG
ncbi:hypothetical protein L1987_39059 [Smallanthus sonchifolius]|uniref:Uncharacterized protein n=1 Tax=Smallanthus sonchifolius TaxID=185202 RepID=A0ACB9HKD0_9ASTR|nr:hypothetical protein L1987_39059 [Smallanthus sonchifolius]